MTTPPDGVSSLPQESGPTYPVGAWDRIGFETATWPRRVVALIVDWWLCVAVSAGFFHGSSLATLAVFLVSQIVLVGTVGMSVGHFVCGLRVLRGDGAWAGPFRAAVRSLLLCLVIPAVVTQQGGRGLHDVAARTVIVRR